MISPSHFSAVVLFALCASVGLRHHHARNPAAHVPLWSLLFRAVLRLGIVLSWVMFLIAR